MPGNCRWIFIPSPTPSKYCEDDGCVLVYGKYEFVCGIAIPLVAGVPPALGSACGSGQMGSNVPSPTGGDTCGPSGGGGVPGTMSASSYTPSTKDISGA
ncbi:MAG TPA: hypothetical protein VKT78_00460, partial [Fimbriimonadaceae bacterium]|nr:hypothetical protein [Fimbriimonadaceae bacterium]